MKANETKIEKFLATNDTTFAIPVYQRNYDWTEKQCKKLLDDILVVGSSEETKVHFIGSIVYVHDDIYTASGLTELTIIDGQQRLTTITLIYIALYRIALQTDNQTLVNRIQKTYLINEFAPETEKLKLKPTENNKEALRYILNPNSEAVIFKEYSKIIENFDYFKSVITTNNFETVLRGLSKLIFVDIALDRQKDDPQRIFESLNSTGLELSQADLIRNYILMGLPRTKQEEVYTNYWEIIEKNAKDETLNKTRVSDFIRDYLTLKNKEIPTIALTSHRTGRYGIIEKMENLRIKELKDFGIDFTKLNSLKGHLSINKFKNINGILMLKNGVILTAEMDKATILEYILHKKNYYPKQIIFIDDQIRNLEAIQKLCNKLKIKFQGFHYIAASLMKVELIDKDLERLRFEILEDKNIWLSYEELRKIKNKEFK